MNEKKTRQCNTFIDYEWKDSVKISPALPKEYNALQKKIMPSKYYKVTS